MISRYLAGSPLIAVLAIAIASCASKPEVRADGDPSVDFSKYETFAFFDDLATDESKYSTIISTRLKDATRRELRRRGYEETAENPQLLVNFNTNVEDRTDVRSSPDAGFYGYRSGMYGTWGSYPQSVHTTHYQEGTLVMDLVDAEKEQLVWQAVAQARLTKKVLENPAATIDQVIADIFAKFPVKPLDQAS